MDALQLQPSLSTHLASFTLTLQSLHGSIGGPHPCRTLLRHPPCIALMAPGMP